jgi:hypothetical protein
MLILNKRRALERMVSLSERLHEAVPEPFSVLASTSFMAMPAMSVHVRERRSPLLTPASAASSTATDARSIAAGAR